MSVEQQHEEKETLTVEVEIPGHDPRVTTELFRKSKLALIERDGGNCWICGCTAEEVGPLEAHHYPIERSLANMVDWPRFIRDARLGAWGPHAQAFDWDGFAPDKWEIFVDDMTVNGLLLCKKHHTGKDEGIHTMPHPLWVVQRYALEGYKFSDVEIIHHEQS